MNKPRLYLTALVLLASASCSNRAKTYPVSGKVMCDGRPAPGAAVFFYRHGGARVSDPSIMGIVKEDGTFELVCGSLGAGAPAGDYDVAIQWKQCATPNGNQGRAADRLKGRYSDPAHPLIHATVEAGANQLAPFDLTAE